MEKMIKSVADHYGYESQSRQLIEEMGELTSAINHYWRKDLQCGGISFDPETAGGSEYIHMFEELADVAVCMEQLIYLTGKEDTILYLMKLKLHRQINRINESRGGEVDGLSL